MATNGYLKFQALGSFAERHCILAYDAICRRSPRNPQHAKQGVAELYYTISKLYEDAWKSNARVQGMSKMCHS